MSRKIKNRIGVRYGRLVVIEFAKKDWDGYNWATYWLCKCACGKEIIVQGCHLQSKSTQSCGCLNREITSKLCKEKIGKNHPNYIHGKRTIIVQNLKEERRKKDAYICQKCDITQEEYYKIYNKKFDVHHIDSDNTNNNLENMITLCRSCHTKLHEESKGDK